MTLKNYKYSLKNRFQKAANNLALFLTGGVDDSAACVINFAQHLTKNAVFCCEHERLGG